jgi:hypothetical protein
MPARLSREAVASIAALALLRRQLSREAEADVLAALEQQRRSPGSTALRTVLAGLWLKGLAGGWGVAAKATDTDKKFNPQSAAVRAIRRDAGKRIAGIDEETRRRVARYVALNQEAGGSVQGLARLIRQDPSGAFSKARARTIARTESATSLNQGAILGYRESGRVEKVRVFDGDSDPECAAANGEEWTLEYAAAHPLSHPNCQRAFAPLIG